MQTKKLKVRPGTLWIGGLAALGLVTAWAINAAVSSSVHLVPVYVATQTIHSNTLITSSDMAKRMVQKSLVPPGSVAEPPTGVYANATIYSGQVIVASDVTNDGTVRQLVRRYGEGYVGVAVQLDPADLPIQDVQPGDIVDVIGLFEPKANHITAQYVAIGVPVLAVDTATHKLVLAVPRSEALTMSKALVIGKVKVVLDPHSFGGKTHA